mmetsp:Transcript_16529/g.31183  ORF Transcript_16529/g.31183 Transcript_16529/m.31183 type:complete len:211 (-) Transcript_16529:1-633(-)
MQAEASTTPKHLLNILSPSPYFFFRMASTFSPSYPACIFATSPSLVSRVNEPVFTLNATVTSFDGSSMGCFSPCNVPVKVTTSPAMVHMPSCTVTSLGLSRKKQASSCIFAFPLDSRVTVISYSPQSFPGASPWYVPTTSKLVMAVMSFWCSSAERSFNESLTSSLLAPLTFVARSAEAALPMLSGHTGLERLALELLASLSQPLESRVP